MRKTELTIGDIGAIQTGFSPKFLHFVRHIATVTDMAFALRVGNPPKIGFNYQCKPMGVKQNTGAKFLFKCLIPTDNRFLKEKSKLIDEEIQQKYGTSQLQITLNEVLSDKASYERIEQKDGRLYLYPKEKLINDKDFKDPNAVKETAFVIDLTQQEVPATNPSTLYQEIPDKSFHEHQPPDWWNDDWGSFKDAQFNLMPVSYSVGAEPAKPFTVLGGENANDLPPRPITGDVDLYAVVTGVNSFINKLGVDGANEKLNLNKSKELREFVKRFSKIVNAMQHQFFGEDAKEKQFSVDDILKLRIEGIMTPAEGAAIYMLNNLVAQTGLLGIDQMLLHGSEIYNPGTPSAVEEILHIMPIGLVALTNNEDQLVELITNDSYNYLAQYPIPVHPKWDMEKWGPVIEQKLALGQEVSPEAKKNYQAYQELIVNKNYDYLDNNTVYINPNWDMKQWDTVLYQMQKKQIEIDPQVRDKFEAYQRQQNFRQRAMSTVRRKLSSSTILRRRSSSVTSRPPSPESGESKEASPVTMRASSASHSRSNSFAKGSTADVLSSLSRLSPRKVERMKEDLHERRESEREKEQGAGKTAATETELKSSTQAEPKSQNKSQVGQQPESRGSQREESSLDSADESTHTVTMRKGF